MEQRYAGNVGYDSCPKEARLPPLRTHATLPLWMKMSDQRKQESGWMNQAVMCQQNTHTQTHTRASARIIRISVPTSGAHKVWGFFSMGSSSAGRFQRCVFPPKCKHFPCMSSPPPSPPPPPTPPPAAAARASSNSRWTRLSVMETARLSSPPPLHVQFVFQERRYGAASMSRSHRASPSSFFLRDRQGPLPLQLLLRGAPSPLISATVYEMLLLFPPPPTPLFFLFLFLFILFFLCSWTSPPSCDAQSRRRAQSFSPHPPTLLDSSRPDL